MSTMHPTDVNAALINLIRKREPAYWQSAAIGLTPGLRPIMALMDTRTLPFADPEHRPSALLVAGLRGEARDTPRMLAALERFVGSAAAQASGVALSVIAAANPDALAGGDWEEASERKADLAHGYPPQDGFYFDAAAPERRYLWRWICYQAPDLVVEVVLSDDDGDAARWEANAAAVGSKTAGAVNAAVMAGDDSLLAALGRPAADAPGTIPGLRLTTHWTGLTEALRTLWAAMGKDGDAPASSGRLALEARRNRTPIEIARVLAGGYGYALDPVNYTQGVGISGRLRLAALDAGGGSPTAGIAELTAPIAADPPAYLAEAGGAALAGVVWAARLADYTGDEAYRRLFYYAADRFISRGEGRAPAPCDPDFRVEDMFYVGAMLGRAYRMSGADKYADMMAAFLTDGGDVQDSGGLFKHARSAPHFWSRGNGFAALGYAEALTYLPTEHPARAELARRHRRHLEAVLRRQQPWGTFGELVDAPGAWGELTATCMVGYALARGLRMGWLADGGADGGMEGGADGYRAGLKACWRAVSERVDDSGGVVDGCISTGVMPDMRAYLNRAAVSGHDDRTGGMALWFACEMHQYLTGAER